MLKKILSIALAVVMIVSVAAFAAAPTRLKLCASAAPNSIPRKVTALSEETCHARMI